MGKWLQTEAYQDILDCEVSSCEHRHVSTSIPRLDKQTHCTMYTNTDNQYTLSLQSLHCRVSHFFIGPSRTSNNGRTGPSSEPAPSLSKITPQRGAWSRMAFTHLLAITQGQTAVPPSDVHPKESCWVGWLRWKNKIKDWNIGISIPGTRYRSTLGKIR